MDRRRQVAYKVRLSDLASGTYVKVDGEWEPNYIQAKDGRALSRVNVIAVIASEPDPTHGSFTIDDGSAQIAVRQFGDKKFRVQLGDVALIIGRPREFEGQIYIVPEIIRKIEDTKWIQHRKLELGYTPVTKDAPAQEETVVSNAPTDRLIATIKKYDKGDGADTEEVLSSLKIDNAELILDNLLKEGEIFELTPGKIKVLE
jgi:uncharacterized protein